MTKDIKQASKNKNCYQILSDAELLVQHLSISKPLTKSYTKRLDSFYENHPESENVAIKSSKTFKPRKWINWAKNQICRPSISLQPKTLQDLIKAVKIAKTQKKKIRCVAGGYTWSSASVVQEDGILVFVDKMTQIYEPVHVEGLGWTVELETGVTVKALDEYLRRHDPPLAMPANNVLDSACLGGILALGSHGAATHSRTLSDLACEVKIVDASGTLNTFTQERNPVEFSAAACNLGLLGIIYSYPILEEYLGCPKQGGSRLKEMVLQNDQTQLLYWPFNSYFKSKSKPARERTQDEIWVKQWRRTDQPSSGTAAWKSLRTISQYISTCIGIGLLKTMSSKPATIPWINSRISKGLHHPIEKVLVAPDAIHFMSNLNNPIVVGLELVFKVDEGPAVMTVKLTREIHLIKIHEYAARGEYPVSMTLDMRFIKASDQIMSYAYDKDPETIFCAFEILSAANTKGFEEFSAIIAQHLMFEYQARY
ncbi:hypothetical protein EC991_011134 [Linnemannia zychae]|nr:hypothetical protein EC991_011134 [Linnemannia zychae]